jgi:hypothetical protein
MTTDRLPARPLSLHDDRNDLSSCLRDHRNNKNVATSLKDRLPCQIRCMSPAMAMHDVAQPREPRKASHEPSLLRQVSYQHTTLKKVSWSFPKRLMGFHLAIKQFFSRHVTRQKEVKCEVKGLPQTLLALAEIHPQAPPPANSWTSRDRLKPGRLESARDPSAGVSHEYNSRERHISLLQRLCAQPTDLNPSLSAKSQYGFLARFPTQEGRDRGPR